MFGVKELECSAQSLDSDLCDHKSPQPSSNIYWKAVSEE